MPTLPLNPLSHRQALDAGVPPSAISNAQQRQFVTRVVGSKATWVDITTGMSVEGMTEVIRSLRPGDLIVEHAIDAIHDGAQVKA